MAKGEGPVLNPGTVRMQQQALPHLDEPEHPP